MAGFQKALMTVSTYTRMWQAAFPGQPHFAGQRGHYEAIRGAQITDLEAEARRKTARPETPARGHRLSRPPRPARHLHRHRPSAPEESGMTPSHLASNAQQRPREPRPPANQARRPT